MSVSINIVPSSSRLHMFGDPDPLSAYSLSGHVSISLSSPYSFFSTRRTARVLLESVSLTFEGQSEINTPETGYAAIRLCSVSRDVAPSEPMELTNHGHEDDTCQWNVIFNLPIPGWLPATSTLGLEELGVRYALYATAKFIMLDSEDNHRHSWSLATLCAPFRSRVRSVDASTPIKLDRFISPDPHPPPMTNYLVNPTPKDSPRIPREVLSKIQVLASVPEFVNIQDTSVPITLRMRTRDLTGDECKRLQIANLSINIIQHEKFRIRPSPAYLTSFPLPPAPMQPPNLPLRDPHPISTLYDLSILHASSSGNAEAITRSFSLLPRGDDGTYKLSSDNYAFIDDFKLSSDATPTWYTMETHVPFAQLSSASVDEEQESWAGEPVIRESAAGALWVVWHDLKVDVTFLYDLDGGEKARETLGFSVPLRFGREAPLRSLDSTTTPLSPPSLSHLKATLPPYSQLYDSNGDRKIDYSVPLPLYTPPKLPLYQTAEGERDWKDGLRAAL
ncbi:uncharacterized protein LACBIDRAFT_298980 [Laccaria bicolor S238N-H82]|uniref:Predicted protein n=1 Tax=Laccaria bicolor (strain S238N-H82 / ATCC MYA-4686) TaxID=486041 RepID=B0DDR9_LACBS|nr:uncharacterized protein LACBIDRAFT_298980 [Laccaria bicolor S238N-H82]EDR07259.1 predicted protein [Laccaria bicolor S238N-H82]|eukprot:XP_001882190.1 predicted protein [Laccaria bicolor S238N-H82]